MKRKNTISVSEMKVGVDDYQEVITQNNSVSLQRGAISPISPIHGVKGFYYSKEQLMKILDDPSCDGVYFYNIMVSRSRVEHAEQYPTEMPRLSRSFHIEGDLAVPNMAAVGASERTLLSDTALLATFPCPRYCPDPPKGD